MEYLLDLFPPPGRLYRLTDSRLNGRYSQVLYAGGRPFRVDHTLGAAFAVRGAAIAQCGWFDQAFELYCEEIDWQWRLARAGWECWIEPAAEIVHLGGQSTSQAPIRVAAFRHLWQSRRRLYEKYRPQALVSVLALVVRMAMRSRLRTATSPELQNALRDIIAAWGPSR